MQRFCGVFRAVVRKREDVRSGLQMERTVGAVAAVAVAAEERPLRAVGGARAVSCDSLRFAIGIRFRHATWNGAVEKGVEIVVASFF